MKNLLQISTYGMKNISHTISIDFANATIETGIKKINNVKGIFGFNGAGKTAFITAVDLYKRIVLDPKYLVQNDTVKKLDKLLNFEMQEFFFSAVFEYERNIVIKHLIKVKKSKTNNSYVISCEDVSLSMGRTLNDKYKSLIHKENNEVTFMLDERITNKCLDFLKDADLEYTSVVSKVIEKMADSNPFDNNQKENLSIAEKVIISLFTNVNNIDVYLSDADSHSNFVIDKDILEELISRIESFKAKTEDLEAIYVDETIVPKHVFDAYSKDNKKLEKFIKAFKPEIKEIVLKKSDDGKYYHVRKFFVYDDYKVELEFESSGIKQLVKLFSYLLKCANGGIVFIDEIDTNINTVYFEKLVSFFRKFGKGQLVFTTHNVEAMNALKKQSRSILVLGENNKMDVWVGKGNKSPIKDYIDGFFPNSPMNIEDFDFVNIFLGE